MATFQSKRIIGLTGLAGSGKDTVRNILVQEQDFCGLAFADHIREMLRALIGGARLNTDFIHERHLKELPIPGIGVSYRHLAQTLGTEWGRSIAPDLWIKLTESTISNMASQGERRFVISDVRFLNEAQWLKESGGEVWRIDRPGISSVRDHESERQVSQIQPDRVILNNGTIEDLWKFVNAVLWDRGVLA
jgi:hypothetical protein